MTAVVTDNCTNCRFTECVTVCPVACFHGDDQMLYVDPETCIDCCACIAVCPVQAIYLESDLPSEKAEWLQINLEKASSLPQVTGKAEPLLTAAEKRSMLGFE